eukprot:COSAG02_NODE_726_length_18005_cov_69.224897_5_plen_88_part_00
MNTSQYAVDFEIIACNLRLGPPGRDPAMQAVVLQSGCLALASETLDFHACIAVLLGSDVPETQTREVHEFQCSAQIVSGNLPQIMSP